MDRLLSSFGCNVVAVGTVAQAIALADGHQFDLLISDIGLPDGNGWELLMQLGEQRPPYAIAMSGFGQLTDRQRSLAAGYRHHLLKPVEPNQLENLLEEAERELRRAERAREEAR
jgi:CheY-like chemotaxis protein